MSNHNFLHPQEIEVFYIIPALRRQLAMHMKQNGLKQKRIAELLVIEDATVSQYMSKKRGNKIMFDEVVMQEIAKSAILIKDKLSLLKEMQHLLRVIKETREICRIHKQISKVPHECNPELINCFGGKEYGNARLQY